MNDMARLFLLIGGICIFTGLVLIVLGKIPGFGKLPGDIIIKKENFTVYVPFMSALLISLMLSLVFFLFNKR